MEKLSAIHSLTGGGLHAETDPPANLPTDCGLVLKLDGTEFVRNYPEGEGTYDCSPDYVVKVTGRVADQAHLDANRISQPE